MAIRLKKYHGLGNDYLVFDPNKNERKVQANEVRMICNRHLGVGADGILYGPLIDDGKIKLRIFNPDGSETEKSGNGVRIFAKYLMDEGYVPVDKRDVLVDKRDVLVDKRDVNRKKFVFSTISGEVEIESLDDKGTMIRVNMGKPSFASSAFPMVSTQESEIVNEPLSFHGNFYNTTCLSVGNPNCVIMMEEISPKVAEALGPYVENSQYFPNRMNMQLLKVLDRENLQIEIYERGAGYTLASGTGACAAAAAARRMGLVDEKVKVHMPGGDLVVEMREDETIYMTGSVGYVGEFILAVDFFG